MSWYALRKNTYCLVYMCDRVVYVLTIFSYRVITKTNSSEIKEFKCQEINNVRRMIKMIDVTNENSNEYILKLNYLILQT